MTDECTMFDLLWCGHLVETLRMWVPQSTRALDTGSVSGERGCQPGHPSASDRLRPVGTVVPTVPVFVWAGGGGEQSSYAGLNNAASSAKCSKRWERKCGTARL